MILNWEEYNKDRPATAKYNSKMLLHMHTKKTASQKEQSLTISQIEFGRWSVENVDVEADRCQDYTLSHWIRNASLISKLINQ